MELKSFNFEGHPFYYREGTSDVEIINAVLVERKEYALPEGAPLKQILDIGANIGVVAVLMANVFPEAQIQCFEPEPANLEILRKNVEPYPNITVHPFALGEAAGPALLYPSTDSLNLGGFSTHGCRGATTDEGTAVPVPMCRLSPLLASWNLGQIDLIKIDCEGAEYAIFEELSEAGLLTAEFIMGEAHGVDDFKMFELLSRQYHLAIIKPMDDPNYPFYARRKS